MTNKIYFLKELIDIFVSILILFFFLPLILIISILIKIDSSGPIFFKQIRIGKDRKQFTIYKFRTMKMRSEDRNESVMHLNEASGPVFKIKNDPRLTGLGKILRKFSLDELPQLINVFKRDMNLIGPRPLPDYEVEEMEDKFSLERHKVRPGITGLWQVSERENISSFENWVKLDLYYIDNWSLILDAKIIFKTISIILFGRGH
tara:strand:- start:557 stop:1168 length:612 start_codon:yes stop_codon:yes gene_type:complete